MLSSIRIEVQSLNSNICVYKLIIIYILLKCFTADKVCDSINSYSCRSTDQCIDIKKKCDSRVDCDDGSDEEDCGK